MLSSLENFSRNYGINYNLILVMKIFTIGHSTRSFEEFLKVLKHYKINFLVDVRNFPSSKKFPWFNKENLEKELTKNQIEYLHYPELGGFRKGGYEAFTKTEEFEKSVRNLVEIIDEKNSAIMCAEWNVMKCHRKYISNELHREGYEIIHIINTKTVKNHKELPWKTLKLYCDKLKDKSNF